MGVTAVGELASAAGLRDGEATVVAELKAGSEEAFAWLIGRYHKPVYSLLYRLLDDPADAPDVTQEVFLKVFRGIRHFNGQSSLKTWLYRIALHEASNRRRWWFRHKVQEASIEPGAPEDADFDSAAAVARDALADESSTPLEMLMNQEIRSQVERALHELAEPYRSTIILRDIEELSYEQIAEVLAISLGTVKSRIVRGREALRQSLAGYWKTGEAVRSEAPAPRKSKKFEVHS
jgi:RNA polymerase sigma-70 factor (ECF subfamily)